MVRRFTTGGGLCLPYLSALPKALIDPNQRLPPQGGGFGSDKPEDSSIRRREVFSKIILQTDSSFFSLILNTHLKILFFLKNTNPNFFYKVILGIFLFFSFFTSEIIPSRSLSCGGLVGIWTKRQPQHTHTHTTQWPQPLNGDVLAKGQTGGRRDQGQIREPAKIGFNRRASPLVLGTNKRAPPPTTWRTETLHGDVPFQKDGRAERGWGGGGRVGRAKMTTCQSAKIAWLAWSDVLLCARVLASPMSGFLPHTQHVAAETFRGDVPNREEGQSGRKGDSVSPERQRIGSNDDHRREGPGARVREAERGTSRQTKNKGGNGAKRCGSRFRE